MTTDDATRLLEAIATNRLLILCGAGLSMAPPSSLPSAAVVAAHCNDQNLLLTGAPLNDDIKGDLEKISRYFRGCNSFESFFIVKLVPWEKFKGEPNSGHTTIADFLACGTIVAAVTTNFDRLVEKAAERLGEPDFRAMVEIEDIPQQTDYHPYVKIHGCEERNRQMTIWCREQLSDSSIITKMTAFKTWLSAHLIGRDLMFVGFWTDWGYLTDAFADSFADILPRHVYLVDPESEDALRQKAPGLWHWAHKPNITFHYIPESGAELLDNLRQRWSRVFLSRLTRDSQSTSILLFGRESPQPSTEGYDSAALYALRRDLTGTPRTAPVRISVPQNSDHIAAAVHSRLLELGASYSEHIYTFQNKRVRLISGRGRLLSAVKSEYQQEPPISPREDIIICAGAISDSTPFHIVRADEPTSIVRKGSLDNWMTHNDFMTQLRQSSDGSIE